MRVVFSAQGESLYVFEAVRKQFAQNYGVESCGFLVSDSSTYSRFIKQEPDFEKNGCQIIKEWEVTRKKNRAPDLHKLRRYEEILGIDAGLFGAIVADRRLIMGFDCTYSQDYGRRFTDDELLSILGLAIDKVEMVFDKIKPDLVVGFICVTMFDYLVYLFARARGVRYLNLRPTRVLDRVMAASTLNDPSPEFISSYLKMREFGSEYQETAAEYIRDVRQTCARYEGVVAPSAKPALSTHPSRKNPVMSLARLINGYYSYKRSIAAKDNHVVDPIRATAFTSFINPLRAWQAKNKLSAKYLSINALSSLDYVFFPLHTEPEVSLLVYGRPYVNQLEVVRQVALSLPVHMCLVIKEHPWMVGKRSLSWYEKLLSIPRVHLVKPDVEARKLIKDASMICVITGSIALEGAILGKPVLTFGDGPFNALPDHMVRQCKSLRDLPGLITHQLTNHHHDESELEAYISTVFQMSESVSLYSVLLKKRNVFSPNKSEYGTEIEKLTRFLYQEARRQIDYDSGFPLAAKW